MPSRIAVVGGGIFGVTAAVTLKRGGYQVDLFEKAADILNSASGINQYRLHHGYHYPRSQSTAISSKAAVDAFVERYVTAVIKDVSQYYAIASERSMTACDRYLEFCNEVGLPYEETTIDVIREDKVSLTIQAHEYLMDPFTLRELCWHDLREAGVAVHLGIEADPALVSGYDFVVNATYALLNALLDDDSTLAQEYQFEVCEKPVVRLPAIYEGKSLVIMDGPFMCFDPFGRTGNFVLGNVDHAIHRTNVGRFPEIPPELQPYLNRGVVENPPVTKFPLFVESAKEFLVDFDKAELVGSMFTVRTVLPHREATDERPTLVTQVGDRMATLFSGKIGTCVAAASEVLELVDRTLGAGNRS